MKYYFSYHQVNVILINDECLENNAKLAVTSEIILL